MRNPDLRVIAGVPFRQQQAREDCGPAALSSLLSHRGIDVPVTEIARATYSPALGGSLLPDLENFARNQGVETRSGRGDILWLRRLIDSGTPVMIPIETGFGGVSFPHYIVVYGFDREGFLVHAGEEGEVYIRNERLRPRWKKFNSLYLYLEQGAERHRLGGARNG